jgi:hypothetical protein
MEPFYVELGYGDVASYGHLHVFRWLHEQGIDLPLSFICQGAADWGHIHILEWYHQLGLGRHEAGDVRMCASESGQVQVLQWLAEHGYDTLDPFNVVRAASQGHWHVLEWMFEQGLDPTTTDFLCKYAAGGGQLAMLQWL